MKSRSFSSYVSRPLEAIDPGATVLTRTPDEAHSVAAHSLRVNIPPREAAECEKCGQPGQMSAITVWSFSGLRPMIATCAPRDASSCAMHRPIPLPPPVTTITCSSSIPGVNTDLYDMSNLIWGSEWARWRGRHDDKPLVVTRSAS